MTVKKYAECQKKQECVCIGMQFLIERPIAVHQCPIKIPGFSRADPMTPSASGGQKQKNECVSIRIFKCLHLLMPIPA